MALIRLTGVSVQFAVYDSQSRSIKNALLDRAVGGRLVGSSNDRITAVRALDGVSLTLGDGDRVGLVGRNGAGKSTLLRIMSGIYEPMSGRVEIRGSVSSLTDLTMGMDPEASGYENIITRAVFLGLTFADARALIPDVQRFSELGAYLALPTRTYSTGMMTRLAFAVSTAVHPDILIMDEMINAGDQHFVDRARRRLQDMISASRIMVIASHSDQIIREFCNKALLLESGRIVAFGSPEEVLQRYQKVVPYNVVA